MLKRKKVRTRGKLSLSKYFQEFKQGDRVAIVREHSQNPKFPKRIQGITGTVEGSRGAAYVVKIKEGNKEKTHIIKPVHLKKIQIK
jgi:large subunit ribosomal protein L21e